MLKMTQFKIEIISDVVCPWVSATALPVTQKKPPSTDKKSQCYVGKRRLEKAIAAYRASHPSSSSSDSFETVWRPFYLDPTAPAAGVDKRAHYYQKFGEERSKTMWARLAALGAEEGMVFKFGGRTGSTRDSHRLIERAGGVSAEVQNDVVEALFRAYFEDERDITSHDVLVDAAVQAGMDRDQVGAWLRGGEGGDDVDRRVEAARSRNIHGMPHFTIQGRHELEGAQDPDSFLRIFEKVREEQVTGN